MKFTQAMLKFTFLFRQFHNMNLWIYLLLVGILCLCTFFYFLSAVYQSLSYHSYLAKSNIIMDLDLMTLGALVTDAPCHVVYALRCQVHKRCNTDDMGWALLVLWFDITHTLACKYIVIQRNWQTHSNI